jgi:hypothetical protein
MSSRHLLPGQLPNEATAVDGAADWTIVQPSGTSKLYKVRPLAGVPNLPASKITSGSFDAARIPNLSASILTSGAVDLARLPAICGFVGSDVETATGSLSTSFAGQLSITTTGITASTVIFILAQFTGYAYRSSGVDQYGIELRLRKGTSTMLVEDVYCCYGAGGLTSASATLGGTAFLTHTETITSNQTYYLDSKMVTGSTSATRVSGRMYILKIR